MAEPVVLHEMSGWLSHGSPYQPSAPAPRATALELLQCAGVDTQRQAEHLASFAREVMPVGCASGFCIMAAQGFGH